MVLRILCLFALTPLLVGVFLRRRFSSNERPLQQILAPIKTWDACRAFLPSSTAIEVKGTKVVSYGDEINIPINLIESDFIEPQLDLLQTLALYRMGKSSLILTHETLLKLHIFLPLFTGVVVVFGGFAQAIPLQILPLILCFALGICGFCSLYLSYIRWQASRLVKQWVLHYSPYSEASYRESVVKHLNARAFCYCLPLSR